MDRCKMKVAFTEVKTEVKTINKINGVSSLTREEIKSCHSILTSKRLNRLENNKADCYFRIGETGEYRESQLNQSRNRRRN